MGRLLNLIVLCALGGLAYWAWSTPAEPEWRELGEYQWRERLSDEQYEVLREGSTEDAYSGELLKESRKGVYHCAGCGSSLFESKAKFDSGTGWPSFDRPLTGQAVTHHRHNTVLAVAVEVKCAKCGGHLGHVFPDGPTDTGNRYCMNSVALSFTAENGEK